MCPAGDALDLGGQIGVADDRVRGAVRAGQLRLLLGRHHANHRGAEVLGPLAQDQPDPAGGGVHHDGVARLHPIGAAHEGPCRHALEHHGGGGLEVDRCLGSFTNLSAAITRSVA